MLRRVTLYIPEVTANINSNFLVHLETKVCEVFFSSFGKLGPVYKRGLLKDSSILKYSINLYGVISQKDKILVTAAAKI